MHALQPKHVKLKKDEIEELLLKYNVSTVQLPKINSTDAGLPDGCSRGDVVKIERKFDDKTFFYYRVVM